MTVNEIITIDARNPAADDLYEACVNAWFEAGFTRYNSYDQVMTMRNADGASVEIGYGLIPRYIAPDTSVNQKETSQ